MEELKSLAAAWWTGDASVSAFDRVDDIVHRQRDQLPALIAALVLAAPMGGLPYIGTTVVEELSFLVDAGELSGEDALQLVRDADLPLSVLFEIFSGAWAVCLERLQGLEGSGFSAEQLSWLLDDSAVNRHPAFGRTRLGNDGLEFDPEETPWQLELKRREMLT